MDKVLKAQATLVGLARLNILSANTIIVFGSIEEVKELIDYREELPNLFLNYIRRGLIRTDSRWSNGPERELVNLVNIIQKAKTK